MTLGALGRVLETGRELLFTALSDLPAADTYWMSYKDQRELSLEEMVNFLPLEIEDPIADTKCVVWLNPVSVSSQLDIPAELLIQGFPGKFVSLIYKIRSLSLELFGGVAFVAERIQDPKQFVQEHQVRSVANWLSSALIYYRMPRQGIRFSAKRYRLPVGITISAQDKVFLDIKKSVFSPISQGRRFKKAFWLGGKEPIVAKGVAPISKKMPIELKALKIFNNKRGVIRTHAVVICRKKRQYTVYQDCYESDFYEVAKKGYPLSLEDRWALGLDWLSGMALFPPYGVHSDLRMENLLVRQSESGIEGVITDLDHFRFHDDEESRKGGIVGARETPPECFHLGAREEAVTPAADVWEMGFNLYALFNRTIPSWSYEPSEKWPSIIGSLEPGWAKPSPAMPPSLQPLVAQMLHPSPKERPAPQQALEIYEKIMDANNPRPLKPLLISFPSDETHPSSAEKPPDSSLPSSDGRICEIE